jgi:biotin carboxylase
MSADARSGRPLLLLLGTGSRTYREYMLRGAALDFDVWLFSDRELTWEAPHVVGHTRLDTEDAGAMIPQAKALAPDGVLTWDETRVVQAAQLAQALGLPGTSPEAALRCRDKHQTRTVLRAAGVPQATSVLVDSLAEARAAAAGVGYPLVLKPRALNASIGVVKVDAPEQLAARFRVARGAVSPGATELAPGGVLVEEYLDGPEVSADAAWQEGRMTLAFVARKQLGFPPYFEEIGHLVDGRDPLLDDARLREVLTAAHAAIGFQTGWTHTEVRITGAGPKVVEINARMGGDRIPDIARLALGVEAAPVAGAIACGRPPRMQPTRRRVAALRFFYPEQDTIAGAVRIDRERLPPTVACAEAVALPGQELLLPPAGHVSSRYALVTVVADTRAKCLADLETAAAAVHLEALRPLPARRH